MEAMVRAILKQYGRLAVPVEALTLHCDLYEAGLTSQGYVHVMLALEEAFDVEFSETLLTRSTLANMRNIMDALQRLLASTGSESNLGDSSVSVSHIPYLRSSDFTGREALLVELRRLLQDGMNSKPARPLVLQGPEGVGKTQLAVAYAYRYGAAYRVVGCLRAEEPMRLATDYAALARSIGLPEGSQAEQPLQVLAVRRWLEQHGDWLLIFDDARSAEALADYLPHSGKGHLLITTCSPDWRGDAESIMVPALHRMEAERFLENGMANTLLGAATGDTGALVELLGAMPLALAQAIAYMKASGIALPAYIDLFQQERQRLLHHQPALSHDGVHPAVVTCRLALARLQDTEPLAVNLLQCCAFLAPDAIPCSLLARDGAFTEAEEAMPAVRLHQLLGALSQYALIELQSERFSLHRLVQTVVRQEMTDALARRSWEMALALYQGAGDVSPTTEIELLRRLLAACKESGDFSEAHRYGEALLRLHEQAAQPNRLQIAGTQVQLAVSAWAIGDWVSARRAAEAAQAYYDELAADAARYDEMSHSESDEFGASLNDLAMLYAQMGEHESALLLLQRLLQHYERLYGAEHQAVVTTISSMGALLSQMGRLKDAHGYYEFAVRLARRIYPEKHPEVAAALHNMGMHLVHMGDAEAGRMHLAWALAIVEGADHPRETIIATALHNLGTVCWEINDIEAARNYFERAVLIRERIGDPHLTASLSRLTQVMLAQEDVEGADHCIERMQALICERHKWPEWKRS